MMPELRWTLLIIGVVFIAILAWWERRRPHQASRQAPHISTEPRPVVSNDPSWGPEVETSAPRVAREPTLTLPEIRTDVRTREPPKELPIVELPPVELPDDDPKEIDEIEEPIVATAPEVNRPEAELEEISEELEEDELEDEALARQEPVSSAEPPSVEPAKPAELPPPVLSTVKPIVDWPPEEQRKLISLRLVARPPERFQGRLIRQALSAEGFVLGDLDIFHKPDAQNRAVLSAASLTKPGTFDLNTMDTQRYVGLNLFAVLPGPRSPRKAFEDLLMTARVLNERLEGALQDERGGPLTPTRIQALRDSLGAEARS